MALPDFSMRQLLEAGVHFGHQSHRWNPKMADYIFGARNNIHIIDLAQTVPLLHRALQAVSDTVAKGGRVLFVGTKRPAQYFVNSRWLGGTLTNWKTISGSIKRLRHLDEVLNSGDATAYTKKERLTVNSGTELSFAYRLQRRWAEYGKKPSFTASNSRRAVRTRPRRASS